LSLIELKMGKGRDIDAWTVVENKPESVTYCFATVDAREPQYRRDCMYTGSAINESSPDNYMRYLIGELKKCDDWNDDGNDGKQDTYSIGQDKVIAKVRRNSMWHKLEYIPESKFADVTDDIVEKMIDLLKSGIRQNVVWENLRNNKDK